MANKSIFHQLYEPESSTYTYLIADKESQEAALIDPVLETVDRDLKLIDELGLKLKYVLDTHVHADHITGAGRLRERTKAKVALSKGAKVTCADHLLEDGEEISLGRLKIKALATPGHTDSCMSYVFENKVFTGDALLIRGTGRTDFQQGSSEKLYESIHHKIFSLPEDTIVYPGHDYRGQTSSSVEMEKKWNPRLGMHKSKADFVKTMSELKLAHPKKIQDSVPANLNCGIVATSRVLTPSLNDGVPEVTPEAVQRILGKVRLIDVRRTEEFNNELGHIAGAELVTLGEDLQKFLAKEDKLQEIVFVCRSGGRSGEATLLSQEMGFTKTANMVGGMILWNEHRYPVER